MATEKAPDSLRNDNKPSISKNVMALHLSMRGLCLSPALWRAWMLLLWACPSSKGKEHGFKETCPVRVSSSPLLDHAFDTEEPKFPACVTLACSTFCLGLFLVLIILRADWALGTHISWLEGWVRESCWWGQGWCLDAWMLCVHASGGIPYVIGWIQGWVEKGSRLQGLGDGFLCTTTF